MDKCFGIALKGDNDCAAGQRGTTFAMEFGPKGSEDNPMQLTPIWSRMQSVPVLENVGPDLFKIKVLPGNRPVVLKGIARHWPAVGKAEQTLEQFAQYLGAFCNEREVSTLFGSPEIKGRFFYNSDMSGFNFEKRKQSLKSVLKSLIAHAAHQNAPAIYAGAVSVREHLPSFANYHTLDIFPDGTLPLASLWIGNRTRMAAHWDQASNVICVIRGRRRYTLFPTSEVRNLYFGPVDLTLGGRPISLVDFHNPDFERHPRFRQAIVHGEFAELFPGDGLFIPSLWLHYAESFDVLGVMINHWWQIGRAPVLNPYQAMLHALLSVGDLTESERAAWHALFDHYVFRLDDKTMDPQPSSSGLSGIMGPDKTLEVMLYLKDALDRATNSIAEGPDRVSPSSDSNSETSRSAW
jgi:hypothetical protein